MPCLINFSGKVLTVGAFNSSLVFLCNEAAPKSGIYHGKLELTEIIKKKKSRERDLNDAFKRPFLETFDI